MRTRCRQNWRKAHAGITMTELMVVILIFSVLLSMAVPSYKYITYSNRVSTEANALLGDLQFARSEAVKEGQTVTICPASTDQTACVVNSTSWQNGWIIFSDVDNNQTVHDSSYILRVRAPFTAKDTFTSDNSLSFVSFNREGFATSFPSTTTGYVTITLHTTPLSSQWTRCVQVFSTGMMNTEKTTDTQGNCS